MHDKDNLSYYNSVVQGVKKNRLFKKHNNVDYSKRLIKNDRNYKRFQRSQNRLSFSERSYDRLHNSSYWFDFGVGNIRTFLILFLLFIAFYNVVMLDSSNIENLNPFESLISLLQEFSNLGEVAKSNMDSFVKSLQSWIVTTSQDFGVTLGSNFLTELLVSNPFAKLMTSIVYSFIAVFNFLKFVLQVVVLIFKIVLGVL